MTSQDTPTLLTLPLELRQEIYLHFYATQAQTVSPRCARKYCRCPSGDTTHNSLDWGALALVCHSVRDEIIDHKRLTRTSITSFWRPTDHAENGDFRPSKRLSIRLPIALPRSSKKVNVWVQVLKFGHGSSNPCWRIKLHDSHRGSIPEREMQSRFLGTISMVEGRSINLELPAIFLLGDRREAAKRLKIASALFEVRERALRDRASIAHLRSEAQDLGFHDDFIRVLQVIVANLLRQNGTQSETGWSSFVRREDEAQRGWTVWAEVRRWCIEQREAELTGSQESTKEVCKPVEDPAISEEITLTPVHLNAPPMLHRKIRGSR